MELQNSCEMYFLIRS